jgi:hypothetical protein
LIGRNRFTRIAATGRSDPTALGLDPTIDVYADEKGSSGRPT